MAEKERKGKPAEKRRDTWSSEEARPVHMDSPDAQLLGQVGREKGSMRGEGSQERALCPER